MKCAVYKQDYYRDDKGIIENEQVNFEEVINWLNVSISVSSKIQHWGMTFCVLLSIILTFMGSNKVGVVNFLFNVSIKVLKVLGTDSNILKLFCNWFSIWSKSATFLRNF